MTRGTGKQLMQHTGMTLRHNLRRQPGISPDRGCCVIWEPPWVKAFVNFIPLNEQQLKHTFGIMIPTSKNTPAAVKATIITAGGGVGAGCSEQVAHTGTNGGHT